MTRNHVDDRGRDEKRRNAPGATRCVFRVGFFDQGQAADARTDDHPDAASLLFGQSLAGGQACVLDGLAGRSNAEMNEPVHRARLLGGHVRIQVKVFDFARKLAGKG